MNYTEDDEMLEDIESALNGKEVSEDTLPEDLPQEEEIVAGESPKVHSDALRAYMERKARELAEQEEVQYTAENREAFAEEEIEEPEFIEAAVGEIFAEEEQEVYEEKIEEAEEESEVAAEVEEETTQIFLEEPAEVEVFAEENTEEAEEAAEEAAAIEMTEETEAAFEMTENNIEEPVDEVLEEPIEETENTVEGVEETDEEITAAEVEEEPTQTFLEEIAEESVEETGEAAEEIAIEAAVEMIEAAPKAAKQRKYTEDVANSAGGGDGDDRILCKNINEIMHDSMMPYTEHVIMDRALPRVEDGLKPVQRRILYTMLELGLAADKPFRKSARIVGDCLGKYHPHGDSSVYSAMVRMAQDFNMRGILVQGHGNFGSVDGDSAAAMRYTEARLAPLAMELLRDIEKDTVKFNLNFDDTLKEPDTLPGRFPNLLVNGATGIAVGLATNIPPHNLAEVIDGTIAFIDNKNIRLKEMLKIIKGPDFPTGGFIIDQNNELLKAYETGKGKIMMRAKIHFETVMADRKNIVITEIPYQVNKAALLQSISEVVSDNKSGPLGGVADIVDESDRNGMRAVLKLKKDANAQKILDALYKATNLQCSFGINMVAICGGRPQQMGLLDIIAYYVDYQREVVLRRTKFELDEAKEREHIVEGLVIAIKNIDEVIRIIKKAAHPTEAKTNLKARFVLSEKQAQAILDMRLARLTSLEINKLLKELEDLKALIKRLTAIVNSKKMQLDVVKTEMLSIKKQFKDERKSRILKDAKDYVIPSDNDLPPVSDAVIAISASGALKRIPYKNYSMTQKEFSDSSGKHEVYTFLVKSETDKLLYCFTSLGNCFKTEAIKISESKWKDKGTSAKSVFKDLAENENIVYVLPRGEEDMPKGKFVFTTQRGMIKITDIKEYDVAKNIYQAMKLAEDDEILEMQLNQFNDTILFVTSDGMVLNADKTDAPVQGRVSIGVKGVNFNEGAKCVLAAQLPADSKKQIVVITNRGNAKRFAASEIERMARYRKGLKIAGLEPDENIIFAGLLFGNEILAVETTEGTLVKKTVKSIYEAARTGTFKSFLKLKKGERISGVWEFKTEL